LSRNVLGRFPQPGTLSDVIKFPLFFTVGREGNRRDAVVRRFDAANLLARADFEERDRAKLDLLLP
jgi:hypothetical protein